MNIQQQRTRWVFLASTVNSSPEPRHLLDVSFGVYCLEQAGIRPDDITLIIDGDNDQFIKEHLGFGTRHERKIYKTSSINQSVPLADGYENLVLFVCGHGGPQGIASKPKCISPHILLNRIDAAGFQRCVIYLGPCNVGVFNYMPVSTTSHHKNPRETEIVVIGSTKFHSSIAMVMKEGMLDDETVSWISNIFLHYVFRWFLGPCDIDGDGKCTIMDSYKFAGYLTNVEYKDMKKKNFATLVHDIPKIEKRLASKRNAFKIYSELYEKKQRKFYEAVLAELKLQIDELVLRRETLLDISMFNVQEPWILNSIPAQDWEYK